MMRRMTVALLLTALLPLSAAPVKPGISEVQDLKKDYAELLQLMPKVAEALKTSDPENSQLILAAYKKALEARTEAEIDAVLQSLLSSRTFDAKDHQERVIASLETMRNLLTKPARKEDLDKQIQKLEEQKKALEDLKNREKELQHQTTPEAEAQALSKEMEQAIAQLGAMIAEQKALAEKTAKDPDGKDKDQDRKAQEALAQKAKELAEQLKNKLGNSDEAKKMEMAQDVKEAGRKTDQASGEMKQASKSMPGKPPEGGEKPPESGDKPDPAQAQASQQEAVQKLEEAKEALERKKRRLDEQLAKAEIQKLKDKQDKLEQDTEKTAESLEKGDKPQPKASQSAKSASKSMGKASSSMSQNQPEPAEQQEQEAIDELQAAVDDIQEQIDQANDEKKKQDLFQLAEELKKVLEGQRQVHTATAELEKAARPLGRPEQLKLAKARTDQKSLAGSLSGAIQKLDQEDADVFSWALKQCQKDMGDISARLEQSKTDAFTQQLEASVEDSLIKLIDALKEEAQKPGPPQGGGGGGGGGKKPLVPPAAQLKFLKALQAAVWEKTKDTDKARFAKPEGYENLSPEEREKVDRIAQEQGRIAGITEEWSVKLSQGRK